jgi:hypothetical protein
MKNLAPTAFLLGYIDKTAADTIYTDINADYNDKAPQMAAKAGLPAVHPAIARAIGAHRPYTQMYNSQPVPEKILNRAAQERQEKGLQETHVRELAAGDYRRADGNPYPPAVGGLNKDTHPSLQALFRSKNKGNTQKINIPAAVSKDISPKAVNYSIDPSLPRGPIETIPVSRLPLEQDSAIHDTGRVLNSRKGLRKYTTPTAKNIAGMNSKAVDTSGK